MNKQKLHTLLKKQQIAVLSTVDTDNKPHSSVMFFTVDEELNFYVITKKNTRKYEDLQNNKNVSLLVIFLTEQKSVAIEGKTEVVSMNSREYTEKVAEIAGKNAKQKGLSWPPPLSKTSDSDILVYKIIPVWVQLQDYTKSKNIYHQIIPNSSEFEPS